jgi:hypothetical protein
MTKEEFLGRLNDVSCKPGDPLSAPRGANADLTGR